jgi:20S proteasome subunit alpha 6
MNRSAYDQDVATWSPQGKLFQVEYARESVKQGSAALGITSKTHVVLAAIKRSLHELSTHQEKIFEIDNNKGIAIAGLTSDARSLATFMRVECLNYKFTHGTPMITGRLVSEVAAKHQKRTMEYSKRPYGVGLLVAGYDGDGPHLFETDPSGIFSEYRAFCIGSRSQSARTYFERNVEVFPDASLEELITHALRALQGSASDTALTIENTSLAVVGKGQEFELLSKENLTPYITALQAERAAAAPVPIEPEEPPIGGAGQQPPEQEGQQQMEVE